MNLTFKIFSVHEIFITHINLIADKSIIALLNRQQSEFLLLFFKLWILLTLVTFFSVAQTENEIVNEFIERYIENTSDEVDIQQFASDLLSYIYHPIDLNKADAQELFAAAFLDGFQSLEIIKHRKKFGNFISIYELQVLPSFSITDIQEILPFVSIKSSPIHLKDAKKIWQEKFKHLLYEWSEYDKIR